MAFTDPDVEVAGYVVTKDDWNILVNNWKASELAAFTTDGDMFIATGANAGKRLNVMGSLDVFLHEAGGLEADVSSYDGFVLIDGGASANWKMSFTEVDAPDANDDTTDGWKVGSIWVDVTNDKAYICLDITDTAAVWTEITVTTAGHTVASHSDTTATGAELETVTDGSDASALHNHTTANLNDTTATGANLNTLTDGSDAEALHIHLSASSTPKVWVQWEQSGAHGIAASYNMTSVTDGGAVGDTDHLWDTDFAGNDYCIVAAAVTAKTVAIVTQSTTGATTLTMFISNAAATDEISHLAAFGAQ